MSLPTPESTSPQALESLLQYLETDYYTRLDGLCSRVALHLAELQVGDKETPQPGSLYLSLSKKLLGQIEQYLRLRRFGLVPYIRELLHKEGAGHDCRACTTLCTGRHASQIEGLRESHQKLKEICFRLQSVAVPSYGTQMVQTTVYRTLRAEMMQIDTALTELFYLEEFSLIPKMLQAQKAIHAHS